MESCDFEEENICGMIQGPGNRKWEQLSSVSGGPQTDFSNMRQCKGDCGSLQIHVKVLNFVQSWTFQLFLDFQET